MFGRAGGGPKVGGPGGELPCDALEPDVVAAVGREVAERTDGEQDCTYIFLDPEFGFGGTVSVRLEDQGENGIPLIKGIWAGEDVAGVGDAAYWAEPVSVLYAVKHGNTYAVQLVVATEDADRKDVATVIMRALLARI